MATTLPSLNMNLPIPVVGEDPGPDYATNINSSLTLIDAHDHSAGNGVLITPNGLNINAPLPLNNNFIISAAGITMRAQTLTPAINTLYESGVDLYYVDGDGNNVRITQSGGIAGSPGSIANLTSPASASYVSAQSTFVWQSDTNTSANMDASSYILRNLTASSKGLTLSAPATLTVDYSIVLPHLPASIPEVVAIDTAGNMYPTQVTVPLLNPDVQAALVPPGAIQMYGGTAAPTGFLMCDGASYLRADYAALFGIIGTAYGTVDGTHFNVPDFRGIFPRGVSGVKGNDPDKNTRTASAPGSGTGNNLGSIQSDQTGPHGHSVTDPSHVHTVLTYNSGSIVGGNLQTGGAGTLTSGATEAHATGLTVNNLTTSESRPLNLYVNFIIKS